MARAGNGLEKWIQRSWPDGAPPWTRDAFAELYAEEQRQVAAERAERLEAQKLARLERENADLRHRIARLEQMLDQGGRKLMQPVIAAIGDTMPKVIDRHLEARRTMVDLGVWDATKSYRPGHCVTDRGASWICIEPTSPGDRPGQGAPWRLAAKPHKGPSIA